MKITKQVLLAAVDLCWEVATEADIDCGPMVFQKKAGDDGIEYWQNNTVRINLFRDLLMLVCPRIALQHESAVKLEQPKEPWQE